MKIFSSWRFVNKDPENLGTFRQINSCMCETVNHHASGFVRTLTTFSWIHRKLITRDTISSRQIQEVFCP